MTEKKSGKSESFKVRRPLQPVHWNVEVPGSKSITNRALALAALSDGTVRLENVLLSEDSETFIRALRTLGYSLSVSEEECCVTVEGCGRLIPCSEAEINVGSSGTAARFLTAMLGVSAGTYRILASGQMQSRPMRPLFEALISLGARIEWLGEEWHLPVDLTGAAKHPSGRSEHGGSAEVDMDISRSTQFLSALLMAAPLLPDGLRIHVKSEKKDGPYVRMTLKMMSSFGVEVRAEDRGSAGFGEYYVPGGETYGKIRSYRIEPDVSAACYFYAAAAVTGGTVQVYHVFPGGMQGDLEFIEVLERMGCAVKNDDRGIIVSNEGKLHGISVDMRDFSDQALTLAAIAPYADGPVEITNIAHVRGQESDRICSIVTNLTRAGISCEERTDGVVIEPGVPKPCVIETFGDHRVAMAFAVMGLGADGIVIDDPLCCAKTFPDYFDILNYLCNGEKE